MSTNFNTPILGGNPNDPVEISLAGWEELGAAILANDKKALNTFQLRLPARQEMLRAAAASNPTVQPLVNRVLLPMMQRQSNVAESAAKQAAVMRRVSDTADVLETATHITPICFDALADAGSNTASVKAPHNGQPYRFLAALGCSTAKVGTRLSKFSLASTNHVVTDNVTYGSNPTKPGIDFCVVSGDNQLAAKLPQYRWKPWGLKRSGVIRPDGIIDLAVENRSGNPASMFIALMLQSSPCGEAASYDMTKGGVYKSTSKATKNFMQKVLKFSMFN